MTLYLTQAASDKNSLLHWYDGVCWQWQYMYRHMVMALLTYHLSSVSNLHFLLGNLLGLMWVRDLGHQVLGFGLGSQVLVNITGRYPCSVMKKLLWMYIEAGLIARRSLCHRLQDHSLFWFFSYYSSAILHV